MTEYHVHRTKPISNNVDVPLQGKVCKIYSFFLLLDMTWNIKNIDKELTTMQILFVVQLRVIRFDPTRYLKSYFFTTDNNLHVSYSAFGELF